MFDVNSLVQSGGLLLIGFFLFAEVGFLLGFFLPGDTLLIAAGIYAHQGKFSLISIMIVAAIAAIAGDNMAYYIGRRAGPSLFKRENSLLLNPKHVKRAEEFYEKHGPKTVLVAHFLPVVRTMTPLLAGVGKMEYKKFLIFDIIGDTAWAILITLVGYYIGSKIPNIDNYIMAVIIAVIVLSISPTLYHFAKVRASKRKTNTDQ